MTARDAIRAREARRSPEPPRPPETDVARLQWAPPNPGDPYEWWTKPQLIELAKSFGLDTSGTKADLIARLTDGPAQG